MSGRPSSIELDESHPAKHATTHNNVGQSDLSAILVHFPFIASSSTRKRA
jgi:hypothetical protein